MGVPVVRPYSTPERISTWSASSRWLVMRLCPGRRRSSSTWTSSRVMGRRGGQPSTTTPMPGPWDSPQVAILKSSPKVLATIDTQPTTDRREPPRRLGSVFTGICRGFSSTYAHEHHERFDEKIDQSGFRRKLTHQKIGE